MAALHDDDWDAWQAEEPYGQVDWALAELQAWFEPNVEQPTAIVFLPSPHPWAAVAYECCYAEHERAPATLLVALLKRWALAYGAEPMAHWGTMLQFHVDRPPTDIETARALAREQLLVAPCTAIMPGNHPAHHAEALMRAHTWFLHERP